ncbi:MAG: hypothetical protein KDE53_22760 [Caldilineaceae bacterium]|nr:hypothetical protein [Caldilineaceae bacterium]MCB0127552.1 hypothetical protein [Caldilineaceae bacterium]
MIHKRRSAHPNHIRVTFELPDSLWANQVYLTGDVVGAPRAKVPMQQERDGAWRLTLDLPTGNQYRYRYQIDQRWYTEWNGSTTQDNVDPNFSVLDLANQPA